MTVPSQDFAPPPPPTCRRWKRKRIHLPIAVVLMLGFGGLMLAAVASVLYLGVRVSGLNTTDLLQDKAQLVMDGMEYRLRAQLDPARAQVEFVERLIVSGQVDPDNPSQLADTLRAALAPAPQITGIAFLSQQNGLFTVAMRQDNGHALVKREHNPAWAEEVLAQARMTGGAVWVDPVWSPEEKTSIVSVRMPVRRGGKFLGVLLTGVSFRGLSRFLADIDQGSETRSFILFDNQYVLAHPALVDRRLDFSKVTDHPPLPTLSELGDPIAGGIWQQIDAAGRSTGYRGGKAGEPLPREFQFKGDQPLDLRLAQLPVGGFVYLLKPLADYGEKPWTLVIALNEAQVDSEYRRLMRLTVVGLGILVVSVLLALMLGKAISRQVKRLAGAAAAMRTLDFQQVPELQDSRFREISDAAQAFNTMVSGLRWFETYVPKALVLRLIRREAGQTGVISEERDVTVLFTDVKGFSAMAETMTPQETACWLNHHFTRIAACIEAEGGTVDKFIGDAVMAFWGAPEQQPDHAVRALRAAHAIARVMAEEAEAARLQGRPAVCLRIGVHSGPVVVGNIGATTSRINYTIVGDTVNTAARLEALGSDLLGDHCCVVLTSGDTITSAGDYARTIPMENIGDFSLRGRVGTVTVWRLCM
ncbi:adenylate/guanylate cyclase domain-containing protein [Oleisolibacter albus]|uniref:adenylate/guanylate cyclase domain-containing protein n=1 Tax=Oleisolibacter albus TaxID=2171757 RepID=UPI000DF2F363|nr:adenylate/guanylate cyclase domain-containing protein [Oleisolibacter albus]